MDFRHVAATAACLLLGAAQLAAETVTTENGGDVFTAGDSLIQTLEADRDVFAAGRSTTFFGRAGGDLHISGFDVKVDADVGEDAYAAGATVLMSGTVGKDLSAMGFTVRLEPGGRIAQNARLLGATVNVDAPIGGSLSVTGRDVYLNSVVAGDVSVLAKTLRFGPEARIDGRLTYTSDSEIPIPESVISPDRVTFQEADFERVQDEWERMRDMPAFPTFASMLFGFLISLLFFVVLGAIALGFFPRKLEAMRLSITNAFGQTVLLGVVGLSLLFGAIPVTALTVVAIPLVPVLVLAIVVAWTLAYGLGAYAVATRLWFGLGGDPDPGPGMRLLLLAAAIVAIALLNFIPFVGWVANYTLVLLGLGAITRALFNWIIGAVGPVVDIDMQPSKDS